MNWLTKAIASISPGWALNRERASHALKAFYEVGESSRLRKSRTDKGSANAQNLRSATKLRILARHMEENLDIANGALDVLVANTVGRGIRPEPQVRDKGGQPLKEVNDQLLKLFEDWRFKPEVTRNAGAAVDRTCRWSGSRHRRAVFAGVAGVRLPAL